MKVSIPKISFEERGIPTGASPIFELKDDKDDGQDGRALDFKELKKYSKMKTPAAIDLCLYGEEDFFFLKKVS